MNTKVCTACKERLPASEFRIIQHRGKPYLQPECLECTRERQRRMYHRREGKKVVEKPLDPLNLLINRWRGRVNRKEPLRWAK